MTEMLNTFRFIYEYNYLFIEQLHLFFQRISVQFIGPCIECKEIFWCLNVCNYLHIWFVSQVWNIADRLFSHSKHCLFILPIDFLLCRKFLISCNPICQYLGLFPVKLGFYLRHLLDLCPQTCPLCFSPEVSAS